MSAEKVFYYNYLADDKLSEINNKLISLINEVNPGHVFEFGSGTSKNLKRFDCVTCGLDISPINLLTAHLRNERQFLILGNEYHLGHLCGFDVVFTCSVLDHIEDIQRIIREFKRIGKTIFLAETNDVPAPHYFPHDYESHGFQKIPDFTWAGEDGANYFIWKWSSTTDVKTDYVNDDLGK